MERLISIERRIIQAVLSGDREAYAELIRPNQDRLFRYCLVLLGNTVDAQEAAHDIFVIGYESLTQFEGRSAFFTWLAHIAHNHCMGLLRKRWRQKTDSMETLLSNGFEPPTRQAAIDRPLLLAEEHQLVQDVLAQLQPDYREILVLREVQEMSYEEIGTFLGCSLDAVKARLRRARAKIQEKTRHFLAHSDSIQHGGGAI